MAIAQTRSSEPEHPYKEMYSKSRRMALSPGTDAPDFTLRSTPDQFRAELVKFLKHFVVKTHLIAADRTPICRIKREHDRPT